MGSPVSNPRINIQLLPAALVTAVADRKDLIVGQIGDGGSAVSAQLYTDVQALTDAEIRTLFGTGDLYYRLQLWRAANGGFSPVDVLPFARAGSSTGATATITAAGTATGNGTFIIQIVDGRLFSATVSVVTGDSANAVAAKVQTAVLALTRSVVTPSTAAAVTTLTANDQGTVADNWGVRVTGAAAGVTLTPTIFSGGGADPSLTGLLDAISGRRYTGVSWPDNRTDARNLIVDLFATRFNQSNAIMDGVIFQGLSATFANATAAVSSLNSQSLVVGGNNLTATGPAILQPAGWTLAYFMGIRARRNTSGASVSDFITATNGPLDAIGGASLASLPYFNTPLARTEVTLPADQYTSSEQVSLEDGGFSTFGVNTAGNAMIMGPVVTTWTTDASGNENDSFHYLNFVDTGSICREIFFNTLRSTFSQSRLTEGDLVPGRNIANAQSIKTELLRIYTLLANQALVQSGREASSFFSTNTTVTVNLAARSATISGPLPIVTQLGVINYSLQLAFTVGQTGTQVTL